MEVSLAACALEVIEAVLISALCVVFALFHTVHNLVPHFISRLYIPIIPSNTHCCHDADNP